MNKRLKIALDEALVVSLIMLIGFPIAFIIAIFVGLFGAKHFTLLENFLTSLYFFVVISKGILILIPCLSIFLFIYSFITNQRYVTQDKKDRIYS
ncbi:hypothetical protein KY343_03660 [Candidatus Woesearchaeota archaeon]|nr:hypothetical protein [Candidatus Woesearchaeota archaeon]